MRRRSLFLKTIIGAVLCALALLISLPASGAIVRLPSSGGVEMPVCVPGPCTISGNYNLSSPGTICEVGLDCPGSTGTGGPLTVELTNFNLVCTTGSGSPALGFGCFDGLEDFTYTYTFASPQPLDTSTVVLQVGGTATAGQAMDPFGDTADQVSGNIFVCLYAPGAIIPATCDNNFSYEDILLTSFGTAADGSVTVGSIANLPLFATNSVAAVQIDIVPNMYTNPTATSDLNFTDPISVQIPAPADSSVPEPASLALVGMGLLAGAIGLRNGCRRRAVRG